VRFRTMDGTASWDPVLFGAGRVALSSGALSVGLLLPLLLFEACLYVHFIPLLRQSVHFVPPSHFVLLAWHVSQALPRRGSGAVGISCRAK
jgi:hypothetical protein